MFNYTLCIPRICKNVTKNDIYSVLNQYNFGKIKKIQIIENKNKKTQKKITSTQKTNETKKKKAKKSVQRNGNILN